MGEVMQLPSGTIRKSQSLSNSTQVPESLNHRLNSYAVAASAAGVSVLALAYPAGAKIVYFPAHVHIAPVHTVPLDLNHDGTVDFNFQDTLSTTTASFFHSGRLSILPQAANEIWGHKDSIGGHYASALKAGVKVGASGKFSSGSRSLAYGRQEGSSFYCEGKWNNVGTRYLGLKFSVNGQTHFGWARLNVTCNAPKVTAVLTGYAYETVANRPIVTGKRKGPAGIDAPAAVAGSLGRLAQGARGTAAEQKP
jgi:hypothetical protein